MEQLSLDEAFDCTPPIDLLSDAQLRAAGWIVLEDATDEDVATAVVEREQMTRPNHRHGKERGTR